MVAFGGGWPWVARSLDALRRNTVDEYEVILVDNGGAEDRQVPRDSRVQLIRNQANVGFGAGSNQGAAGGRANVPCLLNTDTLVEPGWLPPLLDRLADEDVGAVFPAKLNVDRSLQEAGAFATGDAYSHLFGFGATQTRRSTAFRARSITAPPRVWPSPVSVSSQPEGSTRHTGPLTTRTRTFAFACGGWATRHSSSRAPG